MPDVRHMMRESPRDDEDRVDPHVVTRSQIARSEPLGRDDHPAQPPRVERHGSRFGCPTRLHLDEGKDSAAPRNDVHFSARYASAAGEDSPAMQAEPYGCEGFGPAASLF